jgi:pentatricopeptide repeat protein
MGVTIDRPTVNLLMGALARSGDVARTEQWAVFMQEAGIAPNRSTLCALVTACRRGEDHEGAEKWLARMEQMGFAPGDLGSDDEADSDDLDGDTPTKGSSPIQTPPESPVVAPAKTKKGFGMPPPPGMPLQPRCVPAPPYLSECLLQEAPPAAGRDMLPKKIIVSSSFSQCAPGVKAPPGLELKSGMGCDYTWPAADPSSMRYAVRA